MGKFFDDEDADDEELEQISLKHKQFSPADLNESEVNTLFARCLATDKTKEFSSVPLFLVANNAKMEADVIPFKDYEYDKALLTSNRKNILYVLGQLHVVRKEGFCHDLIKSSDLIVKYNGTLWPTSDSIEEIQDHLYKLCQLAAQLRLCTPIMIDDGNYTVRLSSTIKPTISPRDPDFPAWWAEHRSEWEDRPE